MESAEGTSHALSELHVRPVARHEAARSHEQLACPHYLGALPKIGPTGWYVAPGRDQWGAPLSLSGAALKCGVRDRWIGWDFRSPYGRLTLIAHNSRVLILPDWHRPNLGSRVLALPERRIGADGQARVGPPVLRLETFVEPRRFQGGLYRAANWIELGLTQGDRRTRAGYSADADAPKRVFVRPLCRTPQQQLTPPDRYHLPLTGAPKIMRKAEQMRRLPRGLRPMADPRRPQGRRPRRPVVLGIAVGAPRCGMRGYTALSDGAAGLGPQARMRFGCRREQGPCVVPRECVIRAWLVRIDPGALDRALQAWNQAGGMHDEAVALDGKTMKNALDATGHRTHIMSVVGQDSKRCHTPKKSAPSP